MGGEAEAGSDPRKQHPIIRAPGGGAGERRRRLTFKKWSKGQRHEINNISSQSVKRKRVRRRDKPFYGEVVSF